MILIFSERSDRSTIRVQKWLHNYGLEYLIIYPDTVFSVTNYTITDEDFNINLLINEIPYKLSDFTSRWFRRGFIPIDYKEDGSPEGRYTINEHIVFSSYIEGVINSIPGLNDIGQGNFNKLQALQVARFVGLKIPSTIITEDKDELLKFSRKNGRLITKGIYGETFSIDNYKYLHGTKELFVEKLNNQFAYSLAQHLINKKYEIRVFYLDGKIFSMAIFSQDSKETEIDWRRGNDLEIKNRQVPYELPKELNQKIRKFMNKINMNCGSLDFIKNLKNEYIFLEINPVGQYDWVSFYSNYYLHKEIANYFKKLENEKK